jgi:hypothetical protein
MIRPAPTQPCGEQQPNAKHRKGRRDPEHQRQEQCNAHRQRQDHRPDRYPLLADQPFFVTSSLVPHRRALDESWRQQPGTPAHWELAADALRRALAEADRSQIADYRAAEEARIRRFIAAPTPERRT